jgi:DNA-binding FrmR family transcriptional regulator
MAHLAKDKKKLISRVRRIGGQVASLERAIEAEDDCGDVLQQAAAVRGAIQGLIVQLLEDHLREHVTSPSQSAETRSDELEPVLAVLRSYLR